MMMYPAVSRIIALCQILFECTHSLYVQLYMCVSVITVTLPGELSSTSRLPVYFHRLYAVCATSQCC